LDDQTQVQPFYLHHQYLLDILLFYLVLFVMLLQYYMKHLQMLPLYLVTISYMQHLPDSQGTDKTFQPYLLLYQNLLVFFVMDQQDHL